MAGFKAAEGFAEIKAALENLPDVAKKVKGVFQFNITEGPNGEKKTWTVDGNNNTVTEGEPSKKADVTFTMADSVFVQLSEGTLNPTAAFLRGKLKLRGNIALAQKLDGVFKEARKLRDILPKGETLKDITNVQETVQTAYEKAKSEPGLKSSAFITEMQSRISSEGPELVKKIKGIYRLEIYNDKRKESWTIDLKSGNGSMTKDGDKPTTKADCTLSIEDDTFVQILSGALKPQAAFMKGKLKIRGNMGLAMKMGALFDSKKPKAKL